LIFESIILGNGGSIRIFKDNEIKGQNVYVVK